MRPIRLLAVAVLCGSALVGAACADAEAPGSATRDPVIPPGASVAGLDVGGRSLSEAAALIEDVMGDRLRSPIEVRAAGHRRTLRARSIRLRFDALRSARRANIAARRSEGQPVDVQPWLRYSERRLARFVRRLARPVTRRPRNARVRLSVTRISVRRARAGHGIDRRRLRSRLARALRDPAASRVLRAKRKTIAADVTRRDLERRHRVIVTVHRRGFRLRIFRRLRRVASYPVAVGLPGHATPRGRFRIANKAVDPAWSAPDRPWAGAYRNEVVAGGAPQNPLKARWLGIVDGVGIHGTDATWSLGERASHGCIRMSVPDVKRVYRQVPVGALVMIK
jgi:hypothetical protein